MATRFRPPLFQTLAVPDTLTVRPPPPAPPPDPVQLGVETDTLATERAKLATYSGYRTAIIANNLVPGASVPYSIAQVNDMIAEQRAVIQAQVDYIVLMRGF